MNVENVIVEFQQDDNILYVTRRDFTNQNYRRVTEYTFSYGTSLSGGKSKQSTFKSIASAMKKFNKAVDAIKNGTKIK